jgi:hypothetical protein
MGAKQAPAPPALPPEPTHAGRRCGDCHWHSDRAVMVDGENRYRCGWDEGYYAWTYPACTAFTARAGKEGR